MNTNIWLNMPIDLKVYIVGWRFLISEVKCERSYQTLVTCGNKRDGSVMDLILKFIPPKWMTLTFFGSCRLPNCDVLTTGIVAQLLSSSHITLCCILDTGDSKNEDILRAKVSNHFSVRIHLFVSQCMHKCHHQVTSVDFPCSSEARRKGADQRRETTIEKREKATEEKEWKRRQGYIRTWAR